MTFNTITFVSKLIILTGLAVGAWLDYMRFETQRKVIAFQQETITNMQQSLDHYRGNGHGR